MLPALCDPGGGGGHVLDPRQHRVARFREDLALAGLFEQRLPDPGFEPADAPANRRGVNVHGLGRTGQLACSGNGQEGLKVAPVVCLHICRY